MASGTETKTTAITKVQELPEWARDIVKPYVESNQYNLLLPAIPVNAELGYGHKAKLSVTKIDTNPANGEIYKVGSKKEGSSYVDAFALAKPALDKIGTSAGIQFRTQRLDDGRDRDVAGFECMSAMKNESGQVIVKTYSKWIHMKDVEASSRSTRFKYRKQNETDEQIEKALAEEMVQYRRHLAPRAETGAILRAIRGQLGIRSQWTQAELAKPFVMLRVDFQPDASDPDVKRFLLEQGSRASAVLWQQPAVEQGRTSTAEVVHDDDPDPDDVDLPNDPHLTNTTRTESLEQGALPLDPAHDSARDPLDLVVEACRSLGLTPEQKNAMMMKHKGDMQGMLRELNEIADRGGA